MYCTRFHRLTGKLLATTAINNSLVRCISQHPLRFLETQNMWRERDGVSQRWQLIYKAPMDTILKFSTTYLSFTTGIIGIGGIYYGAFVYDVADINKPIVIGDDVVIANSAIECLTYLGAFVALHIAVKIVLAKYVVRLYKDGDEYLAIFRGHFWNSTKKHKFHLKDFHKLNPSVVVPWTESRYSLGSKKGILMENYFKTPEYFHYLINKKELPEETD